MHAYGVSYREGRVYPCAHPCKIHSVHIHARRILQEAAEFGCLSTSASKDVAANFAASALPLIFKVREHAASADHSRPCKMRIADV